LECLLDEAAKIFDKWMTIGFNTCKSLDERKDNASR